MNSKHAMIALAAAVTLLCGCGEKSEQSSRLSYLPVQMDKNADWSIIDKDGKEVVKEEYPADASISSVSDDGSFWVKSGDKYQLFSIDQPKQPLIDEEFTQVTDFDESGLAVVGSPNTPIRIIDTKGRIVATLGSDIKRCYFFKDGYAPVMNTDNLCGIIDKKGNIVVKPIYYSIRYWGNGAAVVKKQQEDMTEIIIDMKGEKQGEINTEKYIPQCFADNLITAQAADDPSSPLIVLDKTGKKLFSIRKAPANENNGSFYKDGYMVFIDEEGKYGVVDNQGETMIRSRYENMVNLGHGEFAAKKGEKWGVVNVKDETLVDFDFSYHYAQGLGDYFLMRDGNTWSLMNKENKEVTALDKIGGYAQDYCIEYVNIDNLVDQTAKMLEEFEVPKTAQDFAEQLNMDIDNNHYGNSVVFDNSFDDKVTVSLSVKFENSLAEEHTHIEKESDGWFTYDKTVSDGWTWRTEPFSAINGKIEISSEIDFTSFVKALDARLKQTHQVVSEGEYTQKVDANGRQATYRLKLEHTYGGLDVVIQEK